MSQIPLAIPITDTPALNLADIQGDIIVGLPKRFEEFLFFQINDAAGFKKGLKQLIPAITSTADVVKARKAIEQHKNQGHNNTLETSGINVAFSFKGLKKLGITESTGDPDFEAGQLAHAKNLGDQGTDADGKFDPKWLPAFKHDIDGIFLFTGDSKPSACNAAHKVEHLLGKSIAQVLKVEGNVRPGKEKGHEHFGFLDGISSPAIAAVTPPLPGQQVVKPGVILIKQEGDVNTDKRPEWAKNGSYLVYRQLNQLVPEFNKFLHDNPIDLPGLPRDKGSELLGARLVGRWKSGAPIDIVPTHDDPVLAADPNRNNNFDFSKVKDQTNCPFAAHIRKTNPRSDLAQFGPDAVARHSIARSGIPFGPEVSPDEAHQSKTQHDRGLSFVCYQSSLANGFEFIQKSWANNVGFPPGKKDAAGNPIASGFDPIIGQNGNLDRTVTGTNPTVQGNNLTLPDDFVVSKGGEYFFSPSLSALKTKFSA